MTKIFCLCPKLHEATDTDLKFFFSGLHNQCAPMEKPLSGHIPVMSLIPGHWVTALSVLQVIPKVQTPTL